MSVRPEIQIACEKFAQLLEEQWQRAAAIKSQGAFTDYQSLNPLIIGFCGGDGIGPIIMGETRRILGRLLAGQLAAGEIEFRDINGLTIENRLLTGKAIPDDTLAELRACPVILKGPTRTPQKGDAGPNIESANVAMRRELDLFANLRPTRVPELGIDWVFFRENTEGAYAVGSKGFAVSPDLAVDFTLVTDEGCRRIIRAAFDYAVKNRKTQVTAVTKANVIKTTDGKFLEIFHEIGGEYPDITCTERYVDIMTANLIDERVRAGFQVVVLPNLYGDIITDEAAQIQGGVGTAGSANIGKKYAMFEAIHGSGDRMVAQGRAIYANPASLLRAAAMLLSHIGRREAADRLNRALDICLLEEKRHMVTGDQKGVTCQVFGDYVLSVLERLA
ncbi:MAG: isocitrate/isopropylmalate dehydrogenase family protein [Peptococcaceae bacterium]|jgi:isocitrate dehydrogenase (NAD+)|nr:isocitrate/isopropylmalate dehydrogenase family protein [Peptococcaceae bacterium]